MALHLTLFTHLCVHLLGLMGHPVFTLIISAVALLAYGLYLVLFPASGLVESSMETRLHEEARRRRLLDMYNLSTYGFRGLEELKRTCNKLTEDHRAHLNTPLFYRHVALSLCKRARRCRRDVEVLCRELDLAILQFDNPDAPGEDEGAESRGRAWIDAVLTALID
ncbi:hypothetical protein C8R44DRAFT_896252 [Mycena epipterygia]|nr:hypothetical protein C8R44DRAFT_896252 [Mycena epipterygia]